MQTRSYRHLSADERETLSLGLAHGHSLRAMARILGRAPSTVRWPGTPHKAVPIPPVQSRATQLPEPITHDVYGNSTTPGCGSMSRGIWRQAGRPSRLRNASAGRILTTCASTSRLRPSMSVCMSCAAERRAVNCWPRCGRHASRVALGHAGEIAEAGFPI